MKKHFHKDARFFRTTSSPPAPIFISLSDLTDVCQCSLCPSSLQAAVTQARVRLCLQPHLSRGVWIVPNLVKAKVFLQKIMRLQYGLVNDRRPEADCEAQCLTALARWLQLPCCNPIWTIPVVRATWWRLSVLLSSQIRWITFTPIVLSCEWKMDHQLCWNALVFWRRLQQQPHFLLSADTLCTTSAVREAPTLGEIHGLTWVWKRV